MSKRKTLLQCIIERREKDRPFRALTPEVRDEGEVLIAWITGDIDTREAADALGIKSSGQICTRAGTVMRNLAVAKHISISWNSPLEPEKNGDQPE